MDDLMDHDEPALARADRELTLSTGTILGIFFGLVVLCGGCFGAGYFMVHKAAPQPLALPDSGTDTLASTGAAKPPAGLPVDSGYTTTGGAGVIAVPPGTTPAPKPAPVVRKRPEPPAPTTGGTETAEAAAPAAAPAHTPAPKPVAPSALLPSAAPPAAGGTANIMVQVAAVSHQEDADLLVGALRARGYTVSARPGAGDSLIHVQVGPFSSKPAAEAMRQRLQSDGYNALLKY